MLWLAALLALGALPACGADPGIQLNYGQGGIATGLAPGQAPAADTHIGGTLALQAGRAAGDVPPEYVVMATHADGRVAYRPLGNVTGAASTCDALDRLIRGWNSLCPFFGLVLPADTCPIPLPVEGTLCWKDCDGVWNGPGALPPCPP